MKFKVTFKDYENVKAVIIESEWYNIINDISCTQCPTENGGMYSR